MDVDRDETAAWKPHVGLVLRISGTPKAVKVRKFLEPAKLDDTVAPSAWAPSCLQAMQHVDKHGPPGQGKASQSGDVISKVYGVWNQEATKQAAIWNMAAEKTAGVTRRHLRGQFPVAVMPRWCRFVL
jgi:hypothetical protein